jgi:hypothetical protein
MDFHGICFFVDTNKGVQAKVHFDGKTYPITLIIRRPEQPGYAVNIHMSNIAQLKQLNADITDAILKHYEDDAPMTQAAIAKEKTRWAKDQQAIKEGGR